MSNSAPLAAVLECDRAVSLAVAAIVRRRGFAVVSFAERPGDLVSTVKALGVDLVVLELAMVGVEGIPVVRDLCGAVPGCVVVLLSPFDNLRGAARAAGAFELVGSDLRRLDSCLDRLQGIRRPVLALAPPPAHDAALG